MRFLLLCLLAVAGCGDPTTRVHSPPLPPDAAATGGGPWLLSPPYGVSDTPGPWADVHTSAVPHPVDGLVGLVPPAPPDAGTMDAGPSPTPVESEPTPTAADGGMEGGQSVSPTPSPTEPDPTPTPTPVPTPTPDPSPTLEEPTPVPTPNPTPTPDPQVVFAEAPLILLPGDTALATYEFEGAEAGLRLDTVFVTNDPQGAFGDDLPVYTPGRVVLSHATNHEAFLLQGTAMFDALGFEVQPHTRAPLALSVHVPGVEEVGYRLSGEPVRLGFQVDSSLVAYDLQQTRLTPEAVFGPLALEQESMPYRVVRQAYPVFNPVEFGPYFFPGVQAVWGVQVEAERNPITLGRVVLRLALHGLSAGNNLQRLSLERDRIVRNITAWCVECQADLQDGPLVPEGNSPDGTYHIIVAFREEEVIVPEPPAFYLLYAEIMGPLVSGAALSVEMLTDTDPVMDIVPFTQCGPADDLSCAPHGFGNTGRLYDTDEGEGLFTGDDPYAFSRSLSSNRNILWTDRSGWMRAFPTFSADGAVEAGSGSPEWTNGWGLGSMPSPFVFVMP